MKKIIYLIIFIFSIVLFQVQYDVFNQKLYDFYRQIDSSDLENDTYKTAMIQLKESPIKDTGENNKIIRDKLLNYAQQNKCDFSYSAAEYENNIYHNYMFIYDPEEDFIHNKFIEGKEIISFSDVKQKEYYSTDLKDKEAKHFLYLDKDYYNANLFIKTHVYNILYENTILKEQTTITFKLKYPKLKFDAVVDDVESLFEEDEIKLNISEASPIDDSLFNYLEVNPDLFLIVIFLLALYIILLVLYLIHKSKEIVVRKLYGNSFNRIYFNVAFPCIRNSIVIFLGTLIIFYLFRIHHFSYLGFEFMIPLLLMWLIFIAMTGLVSFFTFLYIKKVNSVKILKNSVQYKKIYNLNFVCKFAVLMLLASSIVANMVLLPQLISALEIGYKYEEDYRQYIHIQSFDYDKVQKGEEPLGYLQKVYEVYNVMNGKGALYMDFGEVNFVDESDMVFPTNLYVNKNFYNKYPLYDKEGNKIPLSKDNITMFVPEKFQNNTNNAICDMNSENQCNIIPIENELTYNNADVLWTYPKASIVDPVLTVFDQATMKTGYNLQPSQILIPLTKGNPTTYVKTLVKELDVGKIDASRVVDQINNLRDIGWYEIKNISIKLLVYFMVLLAFMYQSIFLYFFHHQQELSIRYLNGNRFMKRYGELFFINSMLYITAGIVAHLIFDLSVVVLGSFILLCILFEVIISVFLIHLFEKKSISSILKGGD